jgi:AraC-like DNA-binding protein
MRMDKNIRRADMDFDPGVGALECISRLPKRVSRAFAFHFPPDDPVFHAHSHGQLTYSPKDPILVSTGVCSFIALPATAVWIPPDTPHRVLSRKRRRMLNLYLSPSLCDELPRSPSSFPMSALLIELLHALSWTSDKAQPAYYRSLAHAVSQEMLRLKDINREAPETALPRPKQAHLNQLAEELARNPSDGRSLSEWARGFGKSSKTLSREIKRDIGMTFREWQLVCKMLEARERLLAGESVKSISFRLGYANPNTLIASFRHLFGITPGSLKAVARDSRRRGS